MNHSRNEMFDSAVERMAEKFHAALEHPVVIAGLVIVFYFAVIGLIAGVK